MPKLVQRLSVIAIWLLGGVLASVLVVRIWPRVHLLARAGGPDDEWTWPKTLQVYPSHQGDPVRLVRIMKAGDEVTPGKYRIPPMEGGTFSGPNPLDDWLSDASFVVRNRTSRNIVSVGISVVFPARQPDVDCPSTTSSVGWCDQHPTWCEGGCPILVQRTLQWGRIPAVAATGLEARLLANHVLTSPVLNVGTPPQGNERLGLAPGQDAALSLSGRRDGLIALIDPRMPFSSVAMHRILLNEGLDEEKKTEPCVTTRQYSRLGCAFVEVSKFNVGIDVVYFEDGTIWGNYGYGYALPNPDGIFTRVDANDFPGIVTPTSAPN